MSLIVLPCPFCGSLRLENFQGGWLVCIDCGARGPSRISADSPLEPWNRRHAPGATLTRHWITTQAGPAWCGANDLDICRTLNIDSVTCAPCLRAANRWAAEQLKKVDAPERFSDQGVPPEKRATHLNPRPGTSVQCGPLTLNIPPGYEVSLLGQVSGHPSTGRKINLGARPVGRRSGAARCIFVQYVGKPPT